MIIESLRSSPAYRQLTDALPSPGGARDVSGHAGSSGYVLAVALAEDRPERRLLVVVPTAADAEEAEADFEVLTPARARTFPQRESVHPELDDPHVEISAKRVDALQAFISGRARILIATGRAVTERFPVPESWSDLEVRLRPGQEIRRDAFIADLDEGGYQRASMVEAVGEYSVRGGILDVYPATTLDPVRIELWGDRIESIRTFDVLDQRSIERLDEVRILPVRFPDAGDGPIGSPMSDERERASGSLLELLPESTLILQVDPDREDESRRRGWEELARRTETPERYQHRPDAVDDLLARFGRIRLTDSAVGDVLDFGLRPPPPIDRSIERLVDVLRDAREVGARVLILCDNDGQVQRLEEILEDAAGSDLFRDVTLGLGPPAGGFIVPHARPPLWLLTDHEIFRRARRPRRAPRQGSRAALESLTALTPGDYIVHMDHGIGQFKGLERVKVGEEEIETLVIEYAGGDILRVPHYRADLVEKWRSETDEDEGTRPRLHSLSGKSWSKLKRRTENAIQTMAAELLELYAARRVSEAHTFSPDSRWQREMESSFIYDDTPDQERVTQEVKRDMQRPTPMDRLICGDVGYGKTEIAIRAAFKAVQDGKQTAVLAPTTVLCEQHLQTFRARLADFPVRIEGLSRFRTRTEQEEVLAGLADGRVDIVIGTHRLLSEDVRFKDLGLLIVDEEQRFGVTQKERLKDLKRSVDVLAMTATPIPRTLHLSLSGLRDLSLIRTPPRNRRPIITHVMTWDDRMLEDAIRLEVDRGGQVFFVHNRVETIQGVAGKVRRLVPDLRVEVGHGQMPERQLEDVMTDFVRGEIDVLVATAIIENGLDVPNANTMIVHRADHFGLAQLYQLRGRVGRSHQRAFCYLVIPPNLPAESERRLQLLERHTELGSGYRIALKDLELRGAGNLLGPEQSGFAHAVGFDMYLRLLEDTVAAMRSGTGDGGPMSPPPEVSISGATYIPDRYIPDEAQKLDLYRRLSKVTQASELDEIAAEIRDRYGPLPDEVERLIATSRIRILGAQLGVERVLAKPGRARVNFRRGAVPRLAALRDRFADRQVEVEVRRLQPLSLAFHVPGSEDICPVLTEALRRLIDEQPELATAG